MTEFRLDEFLPYQLAELASRTSRGFADLYRKKFGISVAEWRVVAHLSQSEEVSVREVHERVQMGKWQVSRAAARLQSAGYIRKRTDPADRRLVQLALTGKGRAMVDEIIPIALAYEHALLARAGDSGEIRKQLKKLLEALE